MVSKSHTGSLLCCHSWLAAITTALTVLICESKVKFKLDEALMYVSVRWRELRSGGAL